MERRLEDTNNASSDVLVELRHVHKDYFVNKKAYPAIKDLSVAFPKVGFVAILGPSGSGKTTLLNLIGGLDRMSSGTLLIHNESTEGFGDKEWDAYRNKKVGFVFQTYNLIPHLTVRQNVEIGLELAGVGAKERKEKAIKVLADVGLGEEINKKPNQLSGGQMQRVAIARALANDPEIILADEPTGALDSVTSVQVLNLIKKIGEDRCVIMVTHNRELAERYATRIIEMEDGNIVSDSAPLASPTDETSKPLATKKTSMSFLSALRSSFRSILTKKGRSSVTAIACAIGIIGVSLVVAVESGFSSYLTQVESGVASSVPFSISPTVYSVNPKAITDPGESYPSDGMMGIYDSSSTLYVAHQNKFTGEYVDYLDKIMTDPSCEAYGTAMSVMFNRDSLNFHFITEDGIGTGNYREVSQYSWAGQTGYSVNYYTQLPSYVMHEIYGQQDKIAPLYDVIQGSFPKGPNELALIVDQYNRVEFSTLQRIGIIPSDTQYTDLGSDLKIPFSDILYEGEGDAAYKEFKCYRNSDFYQTGNPEYDFAMTVDTYSDVTFNPSTGKFEGTESQTTMNMFRSPYFSDAKTPQKDVYMDDATYHPITCRIVGVLRPTKESFVQLMPASIGYTTELKDLMVKDYEKGQPGARIGEAQSKNWFIPRLYTDSTHTEKSPSDGLEILNGRFATIYQTLIEHGGEEGFDWANIMSSTYLTNALEGAIRYVNAAYTYDPKDDGRWYSYSSYNGSFLSWCHSYGSEFDTTKVPKMRSDQETLMKWLDIFLRDGFWSTEGEPSVIDCLAYMNAYSLITSILVFPQSLATKGTLKAYLDDWNVGKNEIDQIAYSDIMGDVTSGLSAIITVVGAILIVLASVSLIVAAVMTAIITYVSVIERTKEIGVLRACGARKRDVGRLFQAECAIIGAVAGALGTGLTYLICIPVNIALKQAFPTYIFSDIASLPVLYALGLFALAILLALLSGLIPSRIAAKRDPVVCLRSE